MTTKPKRSLEELIEASRNHKMTEEEIEEQIIAITVAEVLHGDETTSREAVRKLARAIREFDMSANTSSSDKKVA